jgi:hypothetical protein
MRFVGKESRNIYVLGTAEFGIEAEAPKHYVKIGPSSFPTTEPSTRQPYIFNYTVKPSFPLVLMTLA